MLPFQLFSSLQLFTRNLLQFFFIFYYDFGIFYFYSNAFAALVVALAFLQLASCLRWLTATFATMQISFFSHKFNCLPLFELIFNAFCNYNFTILQLYSTQKCSDFFFLIDLGMQLVLVVQTRSAPPIRFKVQFVLKNWPQM